MVDFFSSRLFIAANFNLDFWIYPHLAKANKIGEGRMMRNEKDLPNVSLLLSQRQPDKVILVIEELRKIHEK
jgi:hypothetical protein